MRVSDHRYDRDRQRIDIALRFIQHEARTRTIRLWTGLTDDRLRNRSRITSGVEDLTTLGAKPRSCAPA